MPRYRKLIGHSGVVAYASTPDSITLTFVDGDRHLHGAQRPGHAVVARMKVLADAGRGLGTFVSQHVRDAYERKL